MRKIVLAIGLISVIAAPNAWAQRTRAQARPCRGDIFYVDVPVIQALPWSSDSFLGVVKQQLQIDANVPGSPWFCGSDQITCPSGQVSVQASVLLKERPGELFREDGHLRFFRIRFQDVRGRDLTVRPDAACAVVAELRMLVQHASGANPETFYVGRECDASAMSAEGAASADMLTWHLPRIGLQQSDVNIAPPASRPTVDLAIVDSGVLPGVGAHVGLSSDVDLLPQQSGLHPHGTAMAILARQIARTASIHSTRVLEAGGTGTSESLAQALDDVLYGSSGGSRPLVINLSLGWPSGLGGASTISDANGSCVSSEDPFGEPVRYLLDIARRLDDGGVRPIFVVAAAGNQPITQPASLFPAPPLNWSPSLCATEPIAGQSWFYPALWNRISSCRGPLTPGLTRVAFGVSVVDDRDVQAGVVIPDAESPLVTPGQHVLVADSGAPVTPAQSTMQCGATSTFPPAITLPAAFTGTSIGSALVSAAAARTQATRIALGQSPLSWNALARLMYLTGRSLCRVTPAGAPVRRLDVARLDQALSGPACEPLIACASSVTSLETISIDLVDTCKTELAACSLETLDSFGNLIASCPPAFQAVPWSASYASPICNTFIGNTPFQNAAQCSGTCPFETIGYRSLFGSLGPEPGNPSCPDCELKANVANATFLLTAELSAQYPPNTTFSEPYLILTGPDQATQQTKTYYTNLLSISSPSSWTPGAYLKVQGSLSSALNLNWANTKATLSLLITAPGATTVKDISALRLVLP